MITINFYRPAVHSVSICVPKRPRTFGNTCDWTHCSPQTFVNSRKRTSEEVHLCLWTSTANWSFNLPVRLFNKPVRLANCVRLTFVFDECKAVFDCLKRQIKQYFKHFCRNLRDKTFYKTFKANSTFCARLCFVQVY